MNELEHHRQPYPRTHDLSLLLHLLSHVSNNTGNWTHLIELNTFAVQFRYEAYSDEDDPLDRDQTLGAVQALLKSVEHQLLYPPS